MAKTDEGKNQIEKNFYYFVDIDATDEKEYKGFIQPDGSHGENLILTNWEGGDGRLPQGHNMLIKKLGFIMRMSDGSDLTPADIGKAANGSFSVKIGTREVRNGSLGEVFKNPVLAATSTQGNVEDSTIVFIPLEQIEPWSEGEALDFKMRVPAMTANTQIGMCVKGILETP